jgi:hypothetical protein
MAKLRLTAIDIPSSAIEADIPPYVQAELENDDRLQKQDDETRLLIRRKWQCVQRAFQFSR